MKILTPPLPPIPDEIVTIRITRTVRVKTHGRGGYFQSAEYELIKLTDTTLEETFDVVIAALSKAEKK